MQAIYARTIELIWRAYKAALSPLFGGRCRFLPTCSAYAAAVLTSHGPVKGSWLAARRLCRCHPLGGSGYDPPPPAPVRTNRARLATAPGAPVCVTHDQA